MRRSRAQDVDLGPSRAPDPRPARSRRAKSRGRRRVGVFLIGAYGNVATCVVAGAAALVRGAMDGTGLVTETPLCAGLPLVAIEDLVFGGWEIRETSLLDAAREFGARNGLLTPELVKLVAPDLRRANREVRTGLGAERESLREAFARLQDELRSFRDRNRLDEVVVVNVASTESLADGAPALRSLAAFRRAVERDERRGIPSSVVYAVAALDAGFPFVDFTPSVAAETAPAREAAAATRVPFAGRDGKTGETLLKTVLAPLFVARHLPVLSWEGFNMLGNRDGETLREAGALAAKVRDKDEALRRILRDDRTHSRVRIDYVPSLDDWKQAYDFVHFRGFLGARMQLHFLWQGCDSALAAPLVLDLVRLTDLARRRGEHGALPWLACFFKTPLGCEEREFPAQMRLLSEWCDEARR
jgi:myo-inositol-1-phosphate synthase